MLKNSVIVVTGGAGLIGQEFAKNIIKNDGIAIVADIDIDSATRVKNQLSEQYKIESIDAISLDINSKDSIQNAIDNIHKKYGQIDALINNAYPKNKNFGNSFLDVEYSNFCENINIHLGGYFLTSQQFIKYFIKQGYGNIINMSSIYGVIAPKFEIYNDTKMDLPVEYAVIKSALVHLTKYMAKYCKGENIRINAMSPGGILDGQDQIFLDRYNSQCLTKGMLDSQDLNGTLIYLLSDMSKYINGQNIIIDDGFTL
jgi:NAD(P)-dependent dehydrogenase (short-subunit alcohol dehydrogenase family)